MSSRWCIEATHVSTVSPRWCTVYHVLIVMYGGITRKCNVPRWCMSTMSQDHVWGVPCSGSDIQRFQWFAPCPDKHWIAAGLVVTYTRDTVNNHCHTQQIFSCCFCHWLLCMYIAGIGLALMYLPSMVMVGYYFQKRRPLAAGIASSGSGFGMLILAPPSGVPSEWVPLEGGAAHSLWRHVTGRRTWLPHAPARGASLPTPANQRASWLKTRTWWTKPTNQEKKKILKIWGIQTRIMPWVIQAMCTLWNLTQAFSSTGRPFRTPSRTNSRYSESVNSGFLYESGRDVSGKSSDAELYYSGISYSGLEEEKEKTYHQLNGKMISSTQSCYELPVHTQASPALPSGKHRQRAETLSAHSPHRLEAPSSVSETAGTGIAQSCHEFHPKSRSATDARHHHRSNQHKSGRPDYSSSRDRTRLRQELASKPMHRQDIFYSGSVASLPQYKSQPDVHSYITSVTVIPQHTLLPAPLTQTEPTV